LVPLQQTKGKIILQPEILVPLAIFAENLIHLHFYAIAVFLGAGVPD